MLMHAAVLSMVLVSCLILLYLQTVLLDKGVRTTTPGAVSTPPVVYSSSLTGVVKMPKKYEEPIEHLSQFEIQERGMPEKWPDYRWYYALGGSELGEQSEIEKLFRKRYKKLMANDTDGVTMTSQLHPACAAAAKLKTQKFGRKYGLDSPCRRPGSKQWEQAEYQVVHNAAYYQGDVWATGRRQKVEWGGSLSHLGSKKHTTVEDNILLRKLPVNKTGTVIEVGYYQPPTDYHSMYHAFVNVLLPMFHATLPLRVRGLEHQIAVFQPVGRTRQWAANPDQAVGKSQLKAHKDTCVVVPKSKCLNNEQGRMLEALAPAGVFMEDSQEVVYIKKLIIGAPTTCQPLWMTDGVVVAAGEVQGKEECEHMYWLWRQTWLKKFRVPAAVKSKGNKVLWATRRNSWARNMLNEEAIFGRIRSLGDQVQTTDFRMPMKDQFALLQTVTHFVTPQGASQLHALMLPPSSIFITIDTHFPSLSGVTVELPWLHYFHFRADRNCDPLYATTRLSCSAKKSASDVPLSHLSVNVTSFIQLYLATTDVMAKGLAE